MPCIIKMAASKRLHRSQQRHVENMNDTNSDDSNSDYRSEDSDTELQNAFSKGLLKPGLNVVSYGPKKCLNHTESIKEVLLELKQDLPWIERLDTDVNDCNRENGDHDEQDDKKTSRFNEDDVHNDFKREMKFYRQAQAAVLEALPRLHKLGIATKRPEDFFAEMAKTDEHMRKVRKKLINKQASLDRSEKARKLRDLKKFGKKVQHEVLLKRQREKKELMESVKKFKRGKKDALDILEDLDRKPGSKKISKKGVPDEGSIRNMGKGKKREYRNNKFGEGGKKRGAKRNSKESNYDESGSNTSKRIREQGMGVLKPGKRGQAFKKKMKRVGKNHRQQIKSRRK